MTQKRNIILVAAGLALLVGPASADTIGITGTIRDFSDSHPDFEGAIDGIETRLVGSTLGADDNPVRSSKTSSQITDAGDGPGFGD